METDLNLEEACANCQGCGKINNKICDACNGKGTVLTKEGRKILEYLKNSIKISEH